LDEEIKEKIYAGIDIIVSIFIFLTGIYVLIFSLN